MLTEDERKRLMKLCLREGALSDAEQEELELLAERLRDEDPVAGERLDLWRSSKMTQAIHKAVTQSVLPPPPDPQLPLSPLYFLADELEA